MPRIKDARDWLLTWSPEEDIDHIPKKIQDFLESRDVIRYYGVCESAGKKHIHVAFTTACTYNSDYKWWEKIFAAQGFKAPALDIKYHNNIIVCAGGYLNGKCIGRKGFTDEQIEYGYEQYILRSARQKVRKFVDDHIVISRDKYECAIGAIMSERSCSKQDAEELAVAMGFVFGTSKRGNTERYAHIYAERKEMSKV